MFFSPSLLCFSFISLFFRCATPLWGSQRCTPVALFTLHGNVAAFISLLFVWMLLMLVVVVVVACVFHAGGQLRSGLSVFRGIAFGYIEKFEC